MPTAGVTFCFVFHNENSGLKCLGAQQDYTSSNTVTTTLYSQPEATLQKRRV